MTITAKLVSDVALTEANPDDQKRGLVGYVRLKFAGLLRLDGVTLRVTEDGAHRLSFPCRTDGRGNRHPLFRPEDNRSREIIEQAVFAALGISAKADR
jgi:hypothetical protein